VRLGATLGLAELLLGGVTTVMDMFWYPRETVLAARDLGMRVATGGIFFDGPGIDGLDPASRLAQAEAFFDEFAGAEDVLPGCLPHGSYTVGPEQLLASKALAAERGGFFCTHAAETRAEREDIEDRYGASVIRHLDALGLLDASTVLAHCVWLDEEEIGILARTGATASHNPLSNLKLASGIAPVPAMLAAGVRVTLGTDGAISGNDLDMWLAMRLAAVLHKGATLDAGAVATGQVLDMVTRDAATALGAGDRIGALEPGRFADMILIDLDRAHAVPLFDPLTHLVYSCTRSDVRHVYVGGAEVVRDGSLVRHDLGATLDAVRDLVPAIAASVAP
jgi:5-methylthioadenosine/S-adenosylhomocysteine deaminase